MHVDFAWIFFSRLCFGVVFGVSAFTSLYIYPSISNSAGIISLGAFGLMEIIYGFYFHFFSLNKANKHKQLHC